MGKFTGNNNNPHLYTEFIKHMCSWKLNY